MIDLLLLQNWNSGHISNRTSLQESFNNFSLPVVLKYHGFSPMVGSSKLACTKPAFDTVVEGLINLCSNV